MFRRIVKLFITLFYKIKNAGKCKINAASDIVLRGCSFAGKNAIGDSTYLSNTSMGYASYIGFGSEFSNCCIGKYCSIGNNVRVVSADHAINMVSTYPAFYSKSYRVSYVKKTKYVEHLKTENGFECEIGNDVWIGDNVLVKGGVKIGNGAIVGMGSIVLHDVPPYTIVAGVPAKEIRKRFDQQVIEQLELIKWWDKPHDWIEKHAEQFENPANLINKLEERNG